VANLWPRLQRCCIVSIKPNSFATSGQTGALLYSRSSPTGHKPCVQSDNTPSISSISGTDSGGNSIMTAGDAETIGFGSMAETHFAAVPVG